MRTAITKQGRKKLETLVESGRAQKQNMQRRSLRYEYALKMISAFSLYISNKYVRNLSLLHLLLPLPEQQTLTEEAQIKDRLDKCERRLELIERQVFEEIKKLLEK